MAFPNLIPRNKILRALLTVVACLGIAAVVPLGCLALMLNALPDACGNTVMRSLPSPDGKVKAVVFERSCGCFTAYSEEVSILPARETLPNDDSGNAFAAGAGYGSVPAGGLVKLAWTDDTHLSITPDPSGHIHHTQSWVWVWFGGLRARNVAVKLTMPPQN